MNPCPCGWLGHDSGRCRCTPDQIARYRARVSGPLLDRIDLGIAVPALPPEALALGVQAQSDHGANDDTSARVRARVAAARDLQRARQGKSNAHITAREINAYCAPDAAGAALLAQAMAQLALSARAYHRILKVARTIADLEGADSVHARDIAEAIGYRRLDRI
jgi:magnesium chelatase family protein